MPMMMPMVGNLNAMLSPSNQEAYDKAAEIVGRVTSVADAIEESEVYRGAGGSRQPSAAQVDEARAVFSALPESVDQTILAALRNAFSRRVAIKVSWVETLGPIEAHVQESANRDLVLIHLACPSGEILQRAAGTAGAAS
jgi:hypothetical protein